nr:immunoglobulin heavy chain junction region [Mus musculus]NSM06128.1 immunoglobulin heavy chain junction region [Mus musculus]NSM06407.1 immunoglobulin heavy chain junction region [Mus musculus]NSM06485.1 immunoglobulin heavy chain junction region [Mus musculus]NSM07444.1 immunoglobulin heavy chain junction region [Mus musculus]
CARYGYGDYW